MEENKQPRNAADISCLKGNKENSAILEDIWEYFAIFLP